MMERGLARARSAAERAERDEVATRVRRAIAKSNLDRKRFAEAIGTSESRLSTYATGSVCPSRGWPERRAQPKRVDPGGHRGRAGNEVVDEHTPTSGQSRTRSPRAASWPTRYAGEP